MPHGSPLAPENPRLDLDKGWELGKVNCVLYRRLVSNKKGSVIFLIGNFVPCMAYVDFY